MYFENIIGQDFAKKYMINSLNKSRISHAYIFEGTSGIGKHKFSVELAKILLDMDNLENSPDYIEINPSGSSIKISQVRELQSDIIIKPHKNHKIYVINEAEKLTVEAQNALLKTLEEPPGYIIIILITENKETLLNTIKSRCEMIKFIPLSIIDIQNYLINKHNIDEKKAKYISSFCRGSISKALELVDSEEFKTTRSNIQNLIELIIEGNIVDMLDTLSSFEQNKENIVDTLDIMITYFRDIMIMKEKVNKEMIINIDQLVYLQNLNKKISYSQVATIIDIIEGTKKKLSSNCNFNISLQVMAFNIHEVIK
jgi:DNA polymerase III subunit delta'